MGPLRTAAAVLAVTIGIVACSGDGGAPVPTPSPTTPAPSSSPNPRPSPSSSPSPAASPTTAACDAGQVLATVASWIEAAGLAPATAWSPDGAGNRFTARTVTGAAYAARLGVDCGLRRTEAVGQGEERLLVAAWTGPRMAWVVQTSETPSAPYPAEATVDLLVGTTQGQFLDGEERAVWAGTLAPGVTFVVGHVDFDLGAAAKDWLAGPGTDDGNGGGDDLLAAEQHGIDALEAAGMREVDIAQPAPVGSQEGYLQFVSPTGQISVADVAPTGWFDPTVPRYYDGPTRIETVGGAAVRVTEPGADAPSYATGAELGFACDAFVWLLEPPLNGTVDEQLATAAAVLGTDTCRAG